MKLILVRHGETYWNEERRVQGASSDIELSEAGVRQARELASLLSKEKIDAVISSPLKRAVTTAEVIAEQHKLPVKIDARLMEIEVGELEGLSLSSLGTTFSQFLMQWWQGGGTENLPGGESLVNLQERSWAAIEPLLAEYQNGTVAVISHYFVILVIICKALDLPLEYFVKFKLDPGGLSMLEFEHYGTRLLTFNDTSYLLVRAK